VPVGSNGNEQTNYRNLAIRMGRAGRDWAEREFDERYVANKVINELYEIS